MHEQRAATIEAVIGTLNYKQVVGAAVGTAAGLPCDRRRPPLLSPSILFEQLL